MIINKELANILVEDRDLSPCGCFLMIVSGKKPLLGEFLLDCQPINGKKSKISAHIADIGSRSYEAIIGTDLLQQVGCNLIAHRGKWGVLIGSKRHIVMGSRKSNDARFHGAEIKNED